MNRTSLRRVLSFRRVDDFAVWLNARPRVIAVVAIGCAIVASTEQALLVQRLLSRYTNEDHALLWLAARDWSRLRIREPTFYGQAYGVTFESIPMAVLHAVGTPYWYALPSALIAMALVAWWALSIAAFRSRLWVPALIAAAAPVILNTDHWVIVGAIGTGVGRLFAAISAALCLVSPAQKRAHVALACGLGGFAIAIDTAAGFLVFPALLWAGLAWCRSRRAWLPMGAAPAAALGWYEYTAWFLRIHPDHALHGGPPFEPEFAALFDNFSHLDRLFEAHAPELMRVGEFTPSVALCLLVLAIAMRGWRAAAACSCYLALLVFVAALPKSLNGQMSLWFPPARMTLAVPMGLWFAATVTIKAASERVTRLWGLARLRQLGVVAAASVVVIALSSAAERAGTWETRTAAIEHVGVTSPFPLRRFEELETLCQNAVNAALEANTRIVIFPSDRTADYGCAALHPELLTAHPGYERRFWVLDRLASQASDRMIVWGVTKKDCRQKRYRRALTACVPVSDGQGARLDFEPAPPLDVLYALGMPPRPFGPGCDPGRRETCTWWAQRFGR